ncbi:MAG: adenylate/guanylate cyclase domain-containing protein, partial [Nitrospinota bacterium]|nr:adenylate/guanylate cyclase domain-containing protein [Nitrospinota bacterium]
LFADVRGFTSLSEKCEPEKVVSMLNDFFSLMVDVIFKYEGTLDKFIGDNIMAVFGAPVSRPDDTERAVLAALEMQETIKTFNYDRQLKNERLLEIGIGINTGEAVAGNIGSEKRMDYTVIGDVVNFADRVQSQSKGGEILISDTTYSKVKDKIAVKRLMPRYVKGKQKEVILYKVLGIVSKKGAKS